MIPSFVTYELKSSLHVFYFFTSSRKEEGYMDGLIVFAAILAVLLFIYLIAVLLRPEDFS